MFSVLLLIIVILQSSQVLELQTQLDERTEEVWTIFLLTLAYVHTAPENFQPAEKIEWIFLSHRTIQYFCSLHMKRWMASKFWYG